MCPTDTTPDPRDMMRAPDEPEFRQPELDGDAAPRGHEAQRDDEPAVGERPPLPLEAEIRAADLAQDATAAPVEDDLSERVKGDSELQRG